MQSSITPPGHKSTLSSNEKPTRGPSPPPDHGRKPIPTPDPDGNQITTPDPGRKQKPATGENPPTPAVIRIFPKEIRQDILAVYNFVRAAKEFAKLEPGSEGGLRLRRFKEKYLLARKGMPTEDPIIAPFISISQRKKIDPAWCDAFFASMELDLVKHVYETQAETLRYVYGAAEVIALIISRIMNLPPEGFYSARMMGRSIQYAAFIRDLQVDAIAGKYYLPLAGSGLDRSTLFPGRSEPAYGSAVTSESGLKTQNGKKDPVNQKRTLLIDYLRRETERCLEWHAEGERGFCFLSGKYLISIKTISDLCRSSMVRISRNPMKVFYRRPDLSSAGSTRDGLRRAIPSKFVIYWRFCLNLVKGVFE